MVGRKIEVIERLAQELAEFQIEVIGATDEPSIKKALSKNEIDLVVIGAGLADEVRGSLAKTIHMHAPGIRQHMIDRTDHSNPNLMIDFTKQKVEEWKLVH